MIGFVHTAVLDRGFLGPIWVYNHEPWALLWPLLTQSQEHIHQPEYVHSTTEVLLVKLLTLTLSICALLTFIRQIVPARFAEI